MRKARDPRAVGGGRAAGAGRAAALSLGRNQRCITLLPDPAMGLWPRQSEVGKRWLLVNRATIGGSGE